MGDQGGKWHERKNGNAEKRKQTNKQKKPEAMSSPGSTESVDW